MTTIMMVNHGFIIECIKKFIYNRFLNHFGKQGILDDYSKHCNSESNKCKIDLPGDQEMFLKFKNYRFKGRILSVFCSPVVMII